MDETEYDRRRTFKRLPEGEKFERLYDMHMTLARALDAQALIKMKDDIEYLKGEAFGIARRKDDTLSTDEKINKALDKRNKVLVWILDRIIAPAVSHVFTIMVLAVLYLAFGGKIPTP